MNLYVFIDHYWLGFDTQDRSSEIEITKEFIASYKNLHNPKPLEPIEFDSDNIGGLEKGEQIFRISNFKGIDPVLQKPITTSTPLFDNYNEHISDIKAICAKVHASDLLHEASNLDAPKQSNETEALKKDILIFQVIPPMQILSNLRFMIGKFKNNGNTFKRLDIDGFILKDKPTAYFIDNSLYFESFYTASRIFDLQEYLREATSQEVEFFFQNSLFQLADKSIIDKIVGARERKAIFKIQKFGRLSPSTTAEALINYGREHNIELEATDNGQKIIIKNDKNYLRNMLKLINEDIYSTPLNPDRTYEAKNKLSWNK
ncbi:MAG: hypothetical protein ACFWTZ_02255 [Burkholderia sp.]|jgi:hypothetical protein